MTTDTTIPSSGTTAGAAVDLKHIDVEFVAHGSDEIRRVIKDFTLHVAPGEFVVLVGRSGCGKTTVLNVVAGLVDITRGRAEVHGAAPVKARHRVGYMFARDALLPWRTARGNVELAMELRNPEVGGKARREQATRLLESLGVGHAYNYYPWQLSQGMRQRVALARTWAIQPDVVLMDEPFAALDAQTRAEVQEQFLAFWAAEQSSGSASRKSVLFVTHDLVEAAVMADRIVVMDQGEQVDEIKVTIERPRDAMALVEDPRFREIHHRIAVSLGK